MQKNNRVKGTKTKDKFESKKIGYYLPIIFIILVVPLIVKCKIIDLPKEVADFWRGGTTHADFFSYYKAIALFMGTVAALMAYGGLFLNGKLPLQNEKKYYIFIVIYSVSVIISAFTAHNKTVALEGFPDMYQGVFVLLSYAILMFILINYTRNEKDIKIFVYSFALLAAVEGLLGVFQYFGYDFLQSDLGMSLILPKNIDSSAVKFTFDKYTISGTLFNTNFVGSFCALVLPLTAALYLSEKSKKASILFGTAALLSFAIWLGCNSRAGYLGIFSAFLVGIIVFRKTIKIHYKKILILLTGFIALTLIFNTASGGRIFNQFSRLNPAAEAEDIKDVSIHQQVRFENVYIKDNELYIKTNRETLIGAAKNSNLEFKDEKGALLEVYIDDEGKIKFTDENYSEYSFKINEDKPSIIEAQIYDRGWKLYIAGNDDLKVITTGGKIIDTVEAPRIKFFDGKETFASNRGYIWSRTIPMLKDTLIIGHGPDNYPLVFPRGDYVGRFNVGSKGMLNIVIDKPHNMYLQTAVNTGVISLLALLAICGMYLFDSMKIYMSGNMESFAEYMGAATFLSVTAYLTAGIFNDNIVSVAPLFWILLGMGIGINRMLKTNSPNQQ